MKWVESHTRNDDCPNVNIALRSDSDVSIQKSLRKFTKHLSCANDSWKIQTFLSKDWKIGDSLNELKNRATVISRPHFNKQRNNGIANSDRTRNKLLQRSVGNMRRTLIHPRDPARLLCRYLLCSTARYREIEMCLAVVPHPIFLSHPLVSLLFSSTVPDILFNGTPLARRLILQSHCIKSKACIKQPFAPLPREPGHPGTRPKDHCYSSRMGCSRHDRIPKGISKCNFQRSASAH